MPSRCRPLAVRHCSQGQSHQSVKWCGDWVSANRLAFSVPHGCGPGHILPVLMPPPARGVHGVSRGKITGIGWPHRHQVVLQTWCGCADTSWACGHGSCEIPPICCTSKLRNLIVNKKKPSPLLPKLEQHVTAVAVTSDLCLCELVVAGSWVEV